jgi:hypothetical protein
VDGEEGDGVDSGKADEATADDDEARKASIGGIEAFVKLVERMVGCREVEPTVED